MTLLASYPSLQHQWHPDSRQQILVIPRMNGSDELLDRIEIVAHPWTVELAAQLAAPLAKM